MGRRLRSRTATVALVALLAVAGACALAPPAVAGGAVWYFDRPSYEPGDVVRAGAAVSWEHSEILGTPDDGPYGAWIAPVADWRVGFAPLAVAEQIEVSRYVGDVRIELGPQEIDGGRYGPNVARVEFRLPPVAPGLYTLLHCNYPCTTALGDITWGVFWVGPPEPGAPSTSGQTPPPVITTAPPTIAAPTTTTTVAPAPPTTIAAAVRTADERSGPDDAPVLAVAAGLVAVGAVGVAATAARRRR